ncbi:hypothetical protein BDB00DRAFT_934655 [Zychaea mexicana]|uniref:uncharacterized protein n=1 Tax=Zychaea mexicana TaxID=64656 RepID=UPI0022FE49EE|nr:uncharacterized protein BDB00DRAFT_934655 [Zychaea mexicana]KAI9466375.1 hypothetical protein BDB00DRAFT_934655 [Zychaea mexicana]
MPSDLEVSLQTAASSYGIDHFLSAVKRTPTVSSNDAPLRMSKVFKKRKKARDKEVPKFDDKKPLVLQQPLVATTQVISLSDLVRAGKDIPKDFYRWMAFNCRTLPDNYIHDGSGLLADLQAIIAIDTAHIDCIISKIKTVVLVFCQDNDSAWVSDYVDAAASLLRVARSLNIASARHLFQQKGVAKELYSVTYPGMACNLPKPHSRHTTKHILAGVRYYAYLVREFGIPVVCLPTMFNPQIMSKNHFRCGDEVATAKMSDPDDPDISIQVATDDPGLTPGFSQSN